VAAEEEGNEVSNGSRADASMPTFETEAIEGADAGDAAWMQETQEPRDAARMQRMQETLNRSEELENGGDGFDDSDGSKANGDSPFAKKLAVLGVLEDEHAQREAETRTRNKWFGILHPDTHSRTIYGPGRPGRLCGLMHSCGGSLPVSVCTGAGEGA
jgi:hypothetical protein